jgi:hypothetical protein
MSFESAGDSSLRLKTGAAQNAGVQGWLRFMLAGRVVEWAGGESLRPLLH